jgi:Flp pilus assembly pilin Flp
MHRILLKVRRLLMEESGHTMVEYLFMLSLVIFAALLGIGVVGDTALDLFTRTKNTMP